MPIQECETRTFSREEFYEFVWSSPATQLAVELGCSDVMIGKVCKAYEIPKPYPGYWAQLANGKAPQKTPLSEKSDSNLQSLSFLKYPEFEATVNEPPPELQYDPDVLEIMEKAKRLGPVEVGQTLRNSHRLVVITKEQFKKRNAESRIPWSERAYSNRSEPSPILEIDVGDGLMNRALRIMDALIKRIEKIGGNVEIRNGGYNDRVSGTVVVIAGEIVTRLRLREKHNQVRIKNEKAKYEWQRNRTELVPSGLLHFDGGPSSYRGPLLKDTTKSKIEDGLGRLILRFVSKAGELRNQRREREERERREAEAARIRKEREEEIRRMQAELQKRQDEEQARLDELVVHANSWQKSRLIREYLDALCEVAASSGAGIPMNSRLAEYLRWGFDQADRLDPLRDSPHSVLDESIDDSAAESPPRKPR